MKSTKHVEVKTIQVPIQASPGFKKKRLSDHKLDVCGLCEFGCRYCSSNSGNYLRINRATFAQQTLSQTGELTLPADDPNLMFHWPDILPNLEKQLKAKPKSWGRGRTLVFSMLTDGFSPTLVRSGTTRKALELVLKHSSFRIRILTKSSIVGIKAWIEFFLKHPDRFVVGVSTGTMDDRWAQRIEVNTPSPTARLRALSRLQDAGVPTYGMLCPVFPDVLEDGRLEELVDRVRPELVETLWAEPYNDRQNWGVVREGYQEGSYGHQWMTDVYEHHSRAAWSRYATELYVRLRRKAEAEGWLHKLAYLLYEGNIIEGDARHFDGLHGVLLQSKPDDDGRSKNPSIAKLQA